LFDISILGKQYDPKIDEHILLLDIRDNKEYKWTTDFEPLNPPPISSTLLPSSTQSSTILSSQSSTLSPSSHSLQNPNTSVNISIIIGVVSLISGVLLSFGGIFLYKWKKNQKEKKNAIPTPGSEEDDTLKII